MELQSHIDEFEAAGVRLFAISYDPVGDLASFASEHGITYSLLYDEDSRVIRQYGILNTLVRPDERVYGIPFPGTYIVDEGGMIVEKLFHREYQVREAASAVLREAFDAPADLSDYPGDQCSEPNVRVSARLGAPDLKFRQLVPLYIRLQLAAGLHVQANPTLEGYFATEVTVTAPDEVRVGEPRYPQAEPFRIEGLDEQFDVYSGDVVVTVDLISTAREVESVPLDIAVTYQACDDHACFIPQTVKLHLDVPLGTLNRAQRRG